MEKKVYDRLQELDHSKFEIVKGEPDIRGWDVRYMTGEKLGSVEELIIDIQEKTVRYMVVDLEENELKLLRRKILIPIGLAELEKKEDDVLIPNISVEQLSRLPDYVKNDLGPLVERRISSILGRELEEARMAEVSPVPVAANEIAKNKKNHSEDIDTGFYLHEHYNVRNLYKNRTPEKTISNNDPEYYQGLRLWEKRNEDGIIDETDNIIETNDTANEEKRKARRNDYRKRRYNENI